MRDDRSRGLSLTGVLAAMAPCVAYSQTQQQRIDMAAHIIGLNLNFLEGQRAGVLPADHASLFPGLAWKQPGYTNICQTYLSGNLDAADAAEVNFKEFPGYFEAGNAVLTTGPIAFAATQQALGALEFLPRMANMTPVVSELGDPAGCLTGGYTTMTLKDLYMRQMRFMTESIAHSIVKSRPDHSDFAMLVGVADSSTYGQYAPPSWEAPAEYQEKCYWGDMENPVADVAAQAAAALALNSAVALKYGSPADQERANSTWIPKAVRAYVYAKKMWEIHGVDASCTNSPAVGNCIGTGCTTQEDDGDPVRQTCILYTNTKSPDKHLFAAAAALFRLTGEQAYRTDADWLFDWSYGGYLYNWNNVFPQGVMILAGAPDSEAAYNRKSFYQDAMREIVKNWSNCSNQGEASFGSKPFCKVTPDGSAYPLDIPWGNMGTTMNGVCAAALYNWYEFDSPNSTLVPESRCFMQRQLGYTFNHKCTAPASASYKCNTPDTSGWSYMVGVGAHYPKKLHSRDAAFPEFRTEVPDPNLLCGALVSGPYAPGKDGEDGRVNAGTDEYTDDRRLWKESEPAIDYASGVICSLMGYAALPDGAFTGCTARSPFVGRV